MIGETKPTILNAFTAFHVVLSPVGIGSGVVAIYGLLKAKTLSRWTHAFLATAATSLAGFLFPLHGITPAQVLDVLSLIALIIASLSLYRHHLQGNLVPDIGDHRRDGALFQRFRAGRPALSPVSARSAMAPTRSEPPFQIAQLAVLLLFAAIGVRAKVLAGLSLGALLCAQSLPEMRMLPAENAHLRG